MIGKQEEHQRFLEGIDSDGKNWLKIAARIGTRKPAQVL
jgi:hypothetical protein